MKIVVIDGQGGLIGKSLVAGIVKNIPEAELIAIGTNYAATAAMLKAGAHAGATGENPVIVNARDADIIAGPVGIAIADSLLGEVTPAMAKAVGQCGGYKVLLPVNKCKNVIIGAGDKSTSEIVMEAVARMKKISMELTKNI